MVGPGDTLVDMVLIRDLQHCAQGRTCDMAFLALVVCFVNAFATMLCFDVIPDTATHSVRILGSSEALWAHCWVV